MFYFKNGKENTDKDGDVKDRWGKALTAVGPI